MSIGAGGGGWRTGWTMVIWPAVACALGAALLVGCGGPETRDGAGTLDGAPRALYATAAAQAYRPIPPPSAATSPAATPINVPLAAPPTTPAATVPAPTVAPDGYDPIALAALMLDLINRDRAAAGLAPVAWDATAAAAAAAHAEDMVSRDFFSHWNPDGLGPDHRYALASGEHAARENLHALNYSSSGLIAVDDWPAVIEGAQSGFMNSPGHRANVLDPAHTHVGIGMAWAADGRFRLAQEFTNQHVQLSAAPPVTARPGEALRVAGAFGAGAAGALLDVAYEPFPAPLTAGELAARAAYTSAAQSIETRPIDLNFDETVVLPAGPPGLYHVRLFVDLASGQALVVDRVVRVE